MARLGELLVGAGLLTPEQLERALRAQVMWGARLGTNLVELDLIDLEELSTHLGHQHRLPAAYARHFERVDAELQALLAPEIANTFCCLPLLRTGPRRDVVIAAASPLSKTALAVIADGLVVEPHQLIVSVAPELRIRYQLERVYEIPRPARFMRAPGELPPSQQFEVLPEFEDSAVNVMVDPTATPAPYVPEQPAVVEVAPATPLLAGDDLEVELEVVAAADEDDRAIAAALVEQPSAPVVAPPIAELDDLPADVAVESAVPRAIEQETSSGLKRRKYVRTIAENEPDRALARISIRRVAVNPLPGIIEPNTSGDTKTLGETTRTIRRATDRDRVADLSLDALYRFVPSCHAATLMVLRGQIATSWKGFCRSGAPPPELAVPLDKPGLVPRAAHRNQTARGPASDLGPIDQLLMGALGHPGGELIVVPISIGGEVMCVIAMVVEPDAASTTPESIAAAAGAAFARLMRDASR